MSNQRLPITILTGFLGAGKTTLMRYLLTHTKYKLAVIINEFGSVGLDGDLIKRCDFCSEDEIENRIIELNNGCLCCTVQDDFLPTMQNLISRSHDLDGIIVETSGLALPRPLLQAIQWPEIRRSVYVNGVVTLVDGQALSQGSPVGDINLFNQQMMNDESIDHIIPINELFKDQLDAADLVLISRSDLLNSHALNQIKTQIYSSIRESTNILPLSFGKIDPSIILGLDRIEKTTLIDLNHNDHDHQHLDVFSENIKLEVNIKEDELEKILVSIISKFKILRIKGRCWLENKSLPLQVQMVGPRFTCWYEAAPNTVWKPKSCGIDLVILGLIDGAGEEIISNLKK